MEMFPVVNLPSFFNMNDKPSYPGRFKYNSAMTQVQLLASSPRTGVMTSQYRYDVTTGHENSTYV